MIEVGGSPCWVWSPHPHTHPDIGQPWSNSLLDSQSFGQVGGGHRSFRQCPVVQFSQLPLNHFELRKIDKNESKFNRKVLKRDKKFVEGEALPIISVSNVRSLIPKIGNFKNDILERNISLSILSEVWEKANCKKQQFE